MLFAATFPPEIEKLAAQTLRNPQRVTLGLSRPVHTVTHALFPVPKHLKTGLLLELLKQTDTDSVLVFTRTKHRAEKLARQIARAGFRATSLHSNRTQGQPLPRQTLTDFDYSIPMRDTAPAAHKPASARVDARRARGEADGSPDANRPPRSTDTVETGRTEIFYYPARSISSSMERVNSQVFRMTIVLLTPVYFYAILLSTPKAYSAEQSHSAEGLLGGKACLNPLSL